MVGFSEALEIMKGGGKVCHPSFPQLSYLVIFTGKEMQGFILHGGDNMPGFFKLTDELILSEEWHESSSN